MRATITNNSTAPQGIRTPLGVKSVKPGQTRTLDIEEGYEDRLLSLPFLKVDVKGEASAIKSGVVQPHEAATEVGPMAETFDAELLSAATDEELAQMHQDKFGKPPHHAAKRETIIAKLVAPADEEV